MLLQAASPEADAEKVGTKPALASDQIGAMFMGITILATLCAYIEQPAIPGWWLPVLALVLAAQNFAGYLLANRPAPLFLSFTFITISIYAAIVTYIDLHWITHPLHLLLIGNFILLSALIGDVKKQLPARLSIDGRQLRLVASWFTAILVGILSGVALLILASLLLDIGLLRWPYPLNLSQQHLAAVIGNYYLLVLLTGTLAICTGLHLRCYLDGQWFLVLPLFIVLGLTSPLGHLVSAQALLSYCPPALDWGVTALAVFFYTRKLRSQEWQSLALAIAGLALLTTRFSTTSPLTFLTLTLTAVLLLALALTRRSLSWFRAHTLNLLAAVYFFVFYLLPRTGKPEAMVLPLLAVVTGLLAMAMLGIAVALDKQRHKPWSKSWLLFVPDFEAFAACFILLATVQVSSGIFLISPNTPRVDAAGYSLHVLLSCLALGQCLTGCLLMGRRTGKTIFYYGFVILLIASYYFLRQRTDWLNFLVGYDPHVLLIFALTFFQTYLLFQKISRPQIAEVFARAACWLPLATIFYCPWEMEIAGSALFALAAVHFGLIYLRFGNKSLMYLAVTLLNFALFQFWRAQAVIDPQFYGIPLGLTLIAIGELQRHELSDNALQGYRAAGLLCIYGTSATQVLLQLSHPVYSIVLGGLALIGIGVGIAVKNNLYLYLASFFLAANVLVYLIKYGAERGILKGLLIIMAGLTFLGLALYFHFKRHKEREDMLPGDE